MYIESGGGLGEVVQSIVAKVREPSNQSTASEYFFSEKKSGRNLLILKMYLLHMSSLYENHSDNEMEIWINLDFEIEKYPKPLLHILIESKNSIFVPGMK